jgi:hypothetical protein
MFDTRRDSEPTKASPLRTPAKEDAETTRYDYAVNRGSVPATIDSNPLYPGIADNFNQKQYGVKNATAQYKKRSESETVSYSTFPQFKKNNLKKGKPKKIQGNKVVEGNNHQNNLIYTREETNDNNKKKKKVSAAVLALHRAKTFPVALWNTLWSIKVWIIVQLPLATLSLIGLGFWYYIEYLKGLEGAVSKDGIAWWERALSLIASTFPDLASAVLSLFGWDIPSIESIFFITYAATLVFCYTIVILVLFSFLSTFSRPLSGKMAGLKWATLLMSLVGYAIPGFNLLPWILVYIWVVALYPR